MPLVPPGATPPFALLAVRLSAAVALATLLLGLPALSGARAQAGASPLVQRQTIRGVVFDSLALEPLASAFVIARPSGSSTTTDSLGRFTLEAEGEVTDLLVYHEALDRMGLGALAATRPAGLTAWGDVELATPSLATLWPQLCNSRGPVGTRSAILLGTVRLSDDVTRVAGARVIVQWVPLGQSEAEPRYESVEAVTDSVGNFVACGAPTFADVSLMALANEAQSGVVVLSGALRPVRRVDLVMVRGTSSALRTTVRGRIVDQVDAPQREFSITMDGWDGSAVSANDGSFRLDGVPLGSRMLYVRAIGYTPVAQVVDLVEGENAPLTIPVSRAVELEGVRVTERAVLRAERSDFELRQRAGFGRFVDSTEIMRAPSVRTAIQMVQIVKVTPGRANEFAISGRNGCRAHVFVDGTPADIELANRIPPEQIAAVEFYRSATMAPVRFIAGMEDTCAVVIFWTKYGLRP
jgi:hypothetical protein